MYWVILSSFAISFIDIAARGRRILTKLHWMEYGVYYLFRGTAVNIQNTEPGAVWEVGCQVAREAPGLVGV